eukprot:gene12582-16873_t
MIFIYSIIFCYIICTSVGKKSITLLGISKATKSFKAYDISIERFSHWFSSSNTPKKLLEQNPGISTVYNIEDDDAKFRAILEPQKYPLGVSITAIINFNTVFDGKSFTTICDENSVTQTVQGPKLIAQVLSSILPTVKTTNICSIDEVNDKLVNESFLEIKFDLPDWFPFKKEDIERDGSENVRKVMETDLTIFLDKVMKLYKSEESLN